MAPAFCLLRSAHQLLNFSPTSNRNSRAGNSYRCAPRSHRTALAVERVSCPSIQALLLGLPDQTVEPKARLRLP
jgi:hypothetical protein